MELGESTFDEYEIYFDEGIEIKTTANLVYNIIFTEKYTEGIVNGLKVNATKEEIKKSLGNPTFENVNILGYKGKQCYVFFSENEVSVYRVEDSYQDNKFLQSVNKFMEDKNTTSFLNSLTDVWKDYDLYTVNDDRIFIRYSVKGVEFTFTSTGGKITFYKNFEGQLSENVTIQNITNENIPQYAKLDLETDLIWNSEKTRKDLQQSYYEEDFIETLHVDYYYDNEIDEELLARIEKIQYKTNKFYVFDSETQKEYSDLKFISIDRKYPNSEIKLATKINEFNWLDDNNFVYSIPNKGIYKYNAITRKITTLVEGNEKYKITKIEENIIYYDENSKLKAM